MPFSRSYHTRGPKEITFNEVSNWPVPFFGAEYRKMIQIQTMRLSSMNALIVSSRKNVILTHEEAESGAVTADDLGKP